MNYIKIFFQYDKKAKSFTLVETLVALFIITVTILGPASVAFTASSYARDTKDNFVALYLAQEAVELLRYKRDSIFLQCSNEDCNLLDDNGKGFVETPKEAAWRIFKNDNDLSGCFTNADGCAFDIKSFLHENKTYPYKSGAHSCDTLDRDDNTGNGSGNTDFMYACNFNSANGWKATRLSRGIKLEKINNGLVSVYSQTYEDDIRVTVEVTYPKNGGVNKVVRVVDFLHSK